MTTCKKRCRINVGLPLVHRWTNVKPPLIQHIVSARFDRKVYDVCAQLILKFKSEQYKHKSYFTISW